MSTPSFRESPAISGRRPYSTVHRPRRRSASVLSRRRMAEMEIHMRLDGAAMHDCQLRGRSESELLPTLMTSAQFDVANIADYRTRMRMKNRRQTSLRVLHALRHFDAKVPLRRLFRTQVFKTNELPAPTLAEATTMNCHYKNCGTLSSCKLQGLICVICPFEAAATMKHDREPMRSCLTSGSSRRRHTALARAW